MKLVSYIQEGHEQLAILANNMLYDMDALHPELPSTMSMFLNYWEEYFPLAEAINNSILEGKISLNKGVPLENAQLLTPIPQPASCRDGYAFRQHVAAARRNRKVDMIPEFDQYPIFYFTNHHSIQGEGDIICMHDHLEKLDFELEVAIVIYKPGKNVTSEQE